ncbi:oocyte zinc finger protein XlCOF7.1-like [Hyperolius riggenbachi]|uniref:oocyte zinc finger protein XlCOF7.1-like n=1 Tax=Hyperolius riggenbachi TaxID=752182 RepID=UPI0035A31773
MEKDGSHMTERILNLTLEIIYLLTGENYVAFKLSSGLVASSLKTQSLIIDPPSHSMRKNNKKVQEATNEIIELLMGEVPISAEDVAADLSMEDEENSLVAHIDLYKGIMVENQLPLPCTDGSSIGPLYSQSPNQEHKTIKDDQDEEMCMRSVELCMENTIPPAVSTDSRDLSANQRNPNEDRSLVRIKEEENPTEISTDAPCNRNPLDGSPSPLYCQDPTKGDQISSHYHQDVNGINIEVEARQESDEEYVRGDDPCKEEEIAADINAVGAYNTSILEKHPVTSPEGEIEDHDITSDSSEEFVFTQNIHPALYSTDQSTNASTHGNISSCPSPLITDHTAQRQGETSSLARYNGHYIQEAEFISNQGGHKSMKTHSCPECGKCFSCKVQFIQHLKTHSIDKPFSCFKCGRCYSTITQLIIHQTTHNGEKPYSCSKCGKCFSRSSNLIKHQRVHTSEKRLQLISHQMWHTEENPCSCSECGKCFSLTGKLDAGGKPFVCSECGKCFSKKVHFLLHEKRHTGEKPYSCPDCGKCFTDRSNLAKHQRIHTGEKPFSCAECGRCFSQRVHLIAHQKRHTGEKPYSCSQCGRCFTQKSTLTRHERVHAGQKPYTCLKCGRCFSNKKCFDKHRNSHT